MKPNFMQFYTILLNVKTFEIKFRLIVRQWDLILYSFQGFIGIQLLWI
jgi:hypothetical protein